MMRCPAVCSPGALLSSLLCFCARALTQTQATWVTLVSSRPVTLSMATYYALQTPWFIPPGSARVDPWGSHAIRPRCVEVERERWKTQYRHRYMRVPRAERVDWTSVVMDWGMDHGQETRGSWIGGGAKLGCTPGCGSAPCLAASIRALAQDRYDMRRPMNADADVVMDRRNRWVPSYRRLRPYWVPGARGEAAPSAICSG